MTNKPKNQINVSGDGNTIGSVSAGDHSKSEGTVNIRQNAPVSESFAMLFQDLQKRVDSIEDSVDRQMAQLAVDGLKEELQKGEAADEQTLEKRLETLKKLMRDISEVAIATIANPAAGFSLIAQKVAAKAQAEGK